MGWKWLEGKEFDEAFKAFPDEEAREAEMDRREKQLNRIAEWIDGIKQDQQNAHYERMSMEECGYDPYEDDEEGAEIHALLQKVDGARQDAELSTLYGALHDLGARMARPYEHWNEEERLIEYMERDRD